VLAREFLSIGDTAAARAMAQEVLEQGNESLQAEAKALLASLG
jgi:FimV-like protein